MPSPIADDSRGDLAVAVAAFVGVASIIGTAVYVVARLTVWAWSISPWH